MLVSLCCVLLYISFMLQLDSILWFGSLRVIILLCCCKLRSCLCSLLLVCVMLVCVLFCFMPPVFCCAVLLYGVSLLHVTLCCFDGVVLGSVSLSVASLLLYVGLFLFAFAF